MARIAKRQLFLSAILAHKKAARPADRTVLPYVCFTSGMRISGMSSRLMTVSISSSLWQSSSLKRRVILSMTSTM